MEEIYSMQGPAQPALPSLLQQLIPPSLRWKVAFYILLPAPHMLPLKPRERALFHSVASSRMALCLYSGFVLLETASPRLCVSVKCLCSLRTSLIPSTLEEHSAFLAVLS